MVTFERAQAVIFDLDDTLLSNWPEPGGRGLHEISRLEAIHSVGQRRSLDGLTKVTPAQNLEAFLSAPNHSRESAVWQILRQTQLVPDREEIDPNNELLVEIVELKDQIHSTILAERGVAVPGAPEFVRNLIAAGLTNMAIASTAIRRDIDLSLQILGLTDLFPSERIISHELLTYTKPNPESFNLAFATLGLPEAARPYTWVFEDDPRGITAARAAGLFVCAITTRFSRAKLEALPVAPDVVAGSFAEFSQLLEVPQT